jgi:class 3 adenylate cyclase
MIVCAQCGRENPADARFCLACGSRLEAPAAKAREERKIVTVLFADLVGFTARSEQLDPEDVRATLSPYYARLRSELERRGGTVEKFIGDAVMAVFGAPVAHEDDPERAVRAGLAIRDAIVEDGQLQVRIAITTGEALVTLDAAPSEGEGMVAGDVVNTAARLQSAAPVNGLLVDETTQRATRQVIRFREAEPVTAKGKTDAIAVWEAQEARSRFGVDLGQSGAPLVGRRRELDLLTGALARAREERSPQLVTLVGVPGIGKSRLVYELWQVIDAEPDLTYWRQGRSLPYGEGVSYWALAEMAKAQAGILESDTPDEAGQKLAEAVAGLGLEHDDRILESLRPLVGAGADADAGGVAPSTSPLGGSSSRLWPTSGRRCWSSRTCTGPTTTCSTSSTTSSTGARACRCWSSAPPAQSCSSGEPAGVGASRTR